MIGYNAELTGLMQNIDRWRAGEREGRQAAINEQAARLERGASRLRGLLPEGDAVFAHLRSGGDPAALPKEAEPFVADYQVSKQALGWR